MQSGPRSLAVAAAIALLLGGVAIAAVTGGAAGTGVWSDVGVSEPVSAFEERDRGAIGGDATDGAPDEAPGDEDGVGPLTRCFTGAGYPISIGEEGATIDAIVHLSVLTDPGAGNEFGLEAAGAIGGDPVVTLAAGVRLTARDAIADGVDPFAAFDVLYAYELRLPMFDGGIGDTEYRDEGSPITSAAGVVPC